MRISLAFASLAWSLLAGCGPAQPPITRDLVAGSYLYRSEDPEDKKTDHAWDRLTLRLDGEYTLVQGGPTKPRSEVTGAWRLSGGSPSEVDLDCAGYPVRVKAGEVRLVLDDDLGIWYAKAR